MEGQVCECYALSRAGCRPASSNRPSILLEYARGISGGAASRDPMNIFSGSAIISLVVCIDQSVPSSYFFVLPAFPRVCITELDFLSDSSNDSCNFLIALRARFDVKCSVGMTTFKGVWSTLTVVRHLRCVRERAAS